MIQIDSIPTKLVLRLLSISTNIFGAGRIMACVIDSLVIGAGLLSWRVQDGCTAAWLVDGRMLIRQEIVEPGAEGTTKMGRHHRCANDKAARQVQPESSSEGSIVILMPYTSGGVMCDLLIQMAAYAATKR